jgi:hypothetical protein
MLSGTDLQAKCLQKLALPGMVASFSPTSAPPSIRKEATMATTFPKIDFTKLDLTKLDLTKLDLPGVDADQVVAALRDAAYITVGFGVLTVQQAQVRRRELVSFLSERFETSKSQVETFVDALERRFGTLDQRMIEIELRFDSLVEQFTDKLPTPAAGYVGQAHTAAKSARQQVRGLLRQAV